MSRLCLTCYGECAIPASHDCGDDCDPNRRFVICPDCDGEGVNEC